MPVVRAWRRLGPFGQIGLVASLSILFVAVATVAVLSYGRGGCVSQQLIARNVTSLANLQATDDYSAAQEQYIAAALKLTDRKAERAAFARLGQETQQWHQAVHAARVTAEAHPLSHC